MMIMVIHFVWCELSCVSFFFLQGVAVCTATCAQLHKRAEKITATLLERGGLNAGDNVVLLYPPGTQILKSHT